MSTTGSSTADKQFASYEPIILVTRGDELPKTNLGRKLHPTYETSIRIKNNSGNQQTTPHYVVKFYDQYRELQESLLKLGIGPNADINIEAPFPPKYTKSNFGGRLTEVELQHRCYLLNKWMSAIFSSYPSFPAKAQVLISEFLSLHDNDDDLERNKDLILSLLRNRKETTANGSFSSSLKHINSIPRQRSNSDLSKQQQQQQQHTSFSTNSTSTAAVAAAASAVNSNGSSSGGMKPLTSENLNAMNATTPKFNSTVAAAFTAPTDRGDKLLLSDGIFSSNSNSNSNNNNSSSSSSGVTLSAAEWEMYERASTVQRFLSVRVTVGDAKLPKGADAKLHHSFQTTLQLLPLSELPPTINTSAETTTAGATTDIDPTAYSRLQQQLPPIHVCRVFDAYRSLKSDLELLHVYCIDDSAAVARDKDAGFTTIVVQSHFPKTLKKSALGFSLGEKELRRRNAIMNLWMGRLLSLFPVLPTDGKNMVLEFLCISTDYTGESPQDVMNATALAILRGSYQPPLMSSRPSPQKRSSLSILFGSKQNAEDLTAAAASFAAESTARNAAGKAAGGAEKAPIQRSVSANNLHNPNANPSSAAATAAASGGSGKISTQRSGSMSLMSQQQQQQLLRAAAAGSDADSEFASSFRETLYEDSTLQPAQEVQVGQFLGCNVCRGELMAKKVGEKASHPSYEVVLRILNLSEVILTEKEKVNQQAYNALIELGPLRVLQVFDVYRKMWKQLEEEHVYSLDCMTEAEAAREHGKRVVLIERDFPRTYRRQSIGIRLKEHQLYRRMVMLNDFMGALLQAFPVLPPAAQKIVLEFLESSDDALLTADADSNGSSSVDFGQDSSEDVARKQMMIILRDKAEKRKAVMFDMLRRTYTPERIPEPAPPRNAFGRTNTKRTPLQKSADSGDKLSNNSNGNGSGGKGTTGIRGSEGGATAAANNSAEDGNAAAQQNKCCTIS